MSFIAYHILYKHVPDAVDNCYRACDKQARKLETLMGLKEGSVTVHNLAHIDSTDFLLTNYRAMTSEAADAISAISICAAESADTILEVTDAILNNNIKFSDEPNITEIVNKLSPFITAAALNDFKNTTTLCVDKLSAVSHKPQI
jgi:hypothetical protein